MAGGGEEPSRDQTPAAENRRGGRRRQPETLTEATRKVLEEKAADPRSKRSSSSRSGIDLASSARAVLTQQLGNVPPKAEAKLTQGAGRKKVTVQKLGVVEDLFAAFTESVMDWRTRVMSAIRRKEIRVIGALDDKSFDEQSF